MPQMAPLMWTILFTTFTSLFMLAMIKTIFVKINTATGHKMDTKTPPKKFFSWAW